MTHSPATDDGLPPARSLWAGEIIRFPRMRTLAALGPAVDLPKGTARHLIVVLPGFMASDRTTGRLRRSLARAGHEVHGWGLGRNKGVTADVLTRLDEHMAAIGVGADRPAILLGWSLGGLIAREYAKHRPESVSRIITMGSPFSGDPRANNVWRFYEWMAGHKVDEPPLDVVLCEKPPQPTTALWSARDGLVAPAAARGRDGERDDAVQLDCRHMEFVSDKGAIRAIGELLRRWPPE